MRFRQGWGIDSRHMSLEKALGVGRGWPRLHPTKGASAVPLASGCRGSCQGPQETPWDQKVSLLLHTQSDPPLSALFGLTPILTRRTQLGRGCPGRGPWRTEGVPESRDGSLKGGGLPLESRGGPWKEEGTGGQRNVLEVGGPSPVGRRAPGRGEGGPKGQGSGGRSKAESGGIPQNVEGASRWWRAWPEGLRATPRGPQKTPQGQVGQ